MNKLQRVTIQNNVGYLWLLKQYKPFWRHIVYRKIQNILIHVWRCTSARWEWRWWQLKNCRRKMSQSAVVTRIQDELSESLTANRFIFCPVPRPQPPLCITMGLLMVPLRKTTWERECWSRSIRINAVSMDIYRWCFSHKHAHSTSADTFPPFTTDY